ncbi:D-tyrosyl-tRNA(Tyr) deacylase [Fonticula alba]|uniref:D-aminoacyl-tRNA deacylase n=1 Tax=Fonticula alba TaxID=691883 RepID=A0A058Z3G8_FONAL|nr:D-tyrosyl-tRNA(Tyr) deacylase [Fonticula alba]KCV68810.1 D-tyrosyl-tRNA(Tyr) deacylase [Fonticula alba]|eukprot:XP_009496381.1 D-tyrosyl-tRNA(Tyr) deacylase [Fonticula alba]
MKCILQRVTAASVTVDGAIVGAIKEGVMVLIGLHHEDKDADLDYIVSKILTTRVFDGEATDTAPGKPWARSVTDAGYGVLSVSQFTLNCRMKGTRPDFHHAMSTDKARETYDLFLEKLRKAYPGGHIANGIFGANMSVNIVNDGPVTITFDSRNRKAAELDKPLSGQ